MSTPTYEETKKAIEDYYSESNFPKNPEYILRISRHELKILLKALKSYYIHYLAGRKRTKKGFDVDFWKLDFVEK